MLRISNSKTWLEYGKAWVLRSDVLLRIPGGSNGAAAEERLAREAGICYQAIAMSTDYDCWKEDEEAVTWDMIVETMRNNADNVKNLIRETLPKIKEKTCACA